MTRSRVPLLLLVAGCLRAFAGGATPVTLGTEAMRRHIATLASDEYEGRAPGTRGDTLTTAYLVEQLQRLGAEPADPAGTYRQEVSLVGIRSTVTGKFSTKGGEVVLEYARDYLARSYRQQSELAVDPAGLVLAGYGIVAPEFGWDDYKSADVRGKVVILLDGEPTMAEDATGTAEDAAFFQGSRQTYYGTAACKIELARQRGATAVFILYAPRTAGTSLAVLANNYRQEIFDLKADAAPNPPCAVQGRMTQEAFVHLSQTAGQDGAGLLQRARQRDFVPVELGATASFKVHNELRSVTSPNIVAKVTGADPALRSEAIVYTAHWDHLGRDDALPGDKIFNGAIDNAAGVTQLLGIVQLFVQARERPGRTVLFLFTTAEEKGYLGARHYVRHPFVPLAQTIANINLDDGNVWGRTADVTNLGYGLTTLDEVLADGAAPQQRAFVRESLDGGSYFFVSDQIEFAKVGVPAVFPGAGSTYRDRPADFGDQKWGEYGAKHYHQVSDEIQDDWDYSGMVEDAEWLWRVGQGLSRTKVLPQWKPDAGFSRPAGK